MMKTVVTFILILILAIYIAAVWVEAKENKEVKKKVEKFEIQLKELEDRIERYKLVQETNHNTTLMTAKIVVSKLQKEIDQLKKVKTTSKKTSSKK